MQSMWVRAPVVWVLEVVNDLNCGNGVEGLTFLHVKRRCWQEPAWSVRAGAGRVWLETAKR